jgi:RES domain-containing protein
VRRRAGAPCYYRGPAFRQSRPRYAEATERTLAASARAGGRFNPAGEFGALYVSLDPDTPLRELRRQAARDHADILALLPRTLFALDVNLHRVLDLTREEIRARCLLSAEALAADDWSACQAVARRARDDGYEAIRFPSATGEGENLAIFMDQLAPFSYVRILNEEEVRPDLPGRGAASG